MHKTTKQVIKAGITEKQKARITLQTARLYGQLNNGNWNSQKSWNKQIFQRINRYERILKNAKIVKKKGNKDGYGKKNENRRIQEKKCSPYFPWLWVAGGHTGVSDRKR